DYTEYDILQMTLLMNSVWKTTKQIEGVQKLKESEEKWRLIINTSPDVISVCNLDGIVTAVSEKGIEKWDFQSADEVIGKKIFEFLHPSSREKAMYFVNELLNGHFTGPAEYIMQRKDGSTFLAEVNGEMIYDLNGKPKEMIFVTRDITERKKAEEAIIKSENKLRFITENTNDVIWVLDPFTQKFTYVSPSVYHLRGFTDEEVMQQKVTEAVLPETVKQVEQDIRNDIAHFLSDPQKQPFTRKVENLQPHKNGSIIETESTTTVCFNNEGN
ncbi:MAG: PAS domain S-box protein, partial [Chitinophagaceae bacterium]